MKLKHISIKDVAEKAGVGLGTASYALNGTGGKKVSEETRRKVLEIAGKLKYQVNTYGRILKMQRTRLIGVVVPTVVHEVIPTFIQGVEDELTANNYTMLFCTYTDVKDLHQKGQNLLDWKVDGIIINPQGPKTHPWLYDYFKKLSLRLPIVCGGGAYQEMFPRVLVDGEAIGRLATEYFLENGHRRIAVIGDNDDWRTVGYFKALEKVGIVPDPAYLYNNYQDMFDERHGFFSWLEHFPIECRPTAVFCLNDVMAAHLMDMATDRHYHLPDDLSFLGTDAMELGRYIRPRLSSIIQGHHEQGAETVRLLMRILDGKPAHNVLLSPSLLKQDSVFNMRS